MLVDNCSYAHHFSLSERCVGQPKSPQFKSSRLQYFTTTALTSSSPSVQKQHLDLTCLKGPVNHIPLVDMSDNGEVEVESPSGYSILPKEVTQEIGSVKLFNKWSYEDVEIRDISLT